MTAPKWFEHLTNALCIIPARVHNLFATDVAFFSLHNPFVAITFNTSDGTEAFNATACITCTFGKRLGQLCGIDITVQRIPKATFQIMGFHERVQFFQLGWSANVHLQTLVAAHACHPFEFLHPFLGMGQTQSTRDVVVHRVIDIFTQRAVHFQRIALHVHHGP